MVAHVVVIGAGVYGAAVAASVTRRGGRATAVDAGAPGGGTSGATFSWTNSCGKQPRSYHDLNVSGMEAHRRLAAEVPHSDWYHETGNLEWAATDDEREALREKVAGVLDYGYEARWLGRAEALDLEPDLGPAALTPGRRGPAAAAHTGRRRRGPGGRRGPLDGGRGGRGGPRALPGPACRGGGERPGG
ncbi:hypothetical protein A6A25_34120 [Saccharothrix sp. CB00851]|nr:hypothetical protein A6A25_34120 [Saccharothrix sp. CB00851]